MNPNDFDATAMETPVLLVDFFAERCPPCRALDHLIDEVIEEFEGGVLILKINAAKQPALAARYGVQGVPTLVGFAGGQPVSRYVGLPSRDKLRAMLDALKTINPDTNQNP